MHEKGRMEPIDLSQIFLSIAAVIPDCGVDAVAAHGCHEDHQRAEAVAEQGNLAVAFREIAHCVDGGFDVLDARISVISLIEAKAMLPVSFGGDGQVDAWLQKRSGATARKPCSANSSQCLRMSAFTPNSSCRTITAEAGEVFGLAIYAENVPPCPFTVI
jgi:hypothetical protein